MLCGVFGFCCILGLRTSMQTLDIQGKISCSTIYISHSWAKYALQLYLVSH